MILQLRQEPEANDLASPYSSPLQAQILRPLRQALRETARILKLAARCEVSVLLAGDAFIRDLNLRYRGMDKPTDVLSFPQDEPLLLGDIAISVETASAQAARVEWPLASELALLAVHGLLHLAGYDDVEEEDAREMEALTRRGLAAARIELPAATHPFFQSTQP